MKVATVVPMAWHAAKSALAAPFFDGVRPVLRELESMDNTAWPTHEQLNTLAAKRKITNAWAKPVRFVPPPDDAISAMRYETEIAATGEVPTRENWHDLFNAMQWIAFPHHKSSINAQHARLLAAGGAVEASARSVRRDVLTMFDESGVIVASADASLLQLIRNFQWRELFVLRRDEVIANMRFMLVGHGLMEKSLSPFIGITAKAMLLESDATTTELDRAAADWLMDDNYLADSHHLAPLPLLGIPGWDARNESAAFYDDTTYFRAGRRR